MTTIDFRVRPPYKSFKSLGIFANPFPIADTRLESYPSGYGRKYIPSLIDGDMGKFIEEMDRAGIRLGVVMGRRTGNKAHGEVDNKDIEELCKMYPDRLTGFPGLNPNEGKPLEDIKRWKDLGCKGIAVDPGWLIPEAKADDKVLMPIYEECAKQGLIVSITLSAFLGSTIAFSEPSALHAVANAFPEMNIVVPHACWPWCSQAFGVALMKQNVHLLPDTYFYVQDFPQAHNFVDACNSGFLKHKMLFASSYPIRGLEETVELWKEKPFERDVLHHTLYHNAARLLKL